MAAPVYKRGRLLRQAVHGLSRALPWQEKIGHILRQAQRIGRGHRANSPEAGAIPLHQTNPEFPQVSEYHPSGKAYTRGSDLADVAGAHGQPCDAEGVWGGGKQIMMNNL